MRIDVPRALDRRAVGAVAIAVLVGMLSCGNQSFACTDDASCSGGLCQPAGFCSFPDETCASGQRYGEHASKAYASECVDDGTGTSTSTSGTTHAVDTEISSTLSGASSEASSSDDAHPTPDVGSPQPECVELEFDFLPLPGWTAFSNGATASVSDGRLSIALPPAGEGSAGLTRDSMAVGARRFELAIVSAADAMSHARVGFALVTAEGATYRLYVGDLAVTASVEQRDGEVVLASLAVDATQSQTLRMVLTDTIRFQLSGAGADLDVWTEPVAVEMGSLSVVAYAPPDNTVDPGTVVIDRVSDCPEDG